MEKQEILNKYSEKQDKLLVSQILDRVNLSNKRNKIEDTDFLDSRQIQIAIEVLKFANVTNYILNGGFEESERKILMIYPEKFNSEIVNKNIGNFIKIIRILLPEDLYEKYTHKDYLGGIIKLGVEREKIGDILVTSNGADIILKKETIEFLEQNLSSLKRFGKSKIETEEIQNLRKVEVKKEEFQILASSLRLDNILSEIIRTSRNKAVDYIENERVFVNYKCETKKTKIINSGDVISVRGKGRFVIREFISKTKSGRDVIIVEKYI